ncbi:MAG: YeeE/YedE family protein [Chlorobi bacterium]|nr:YeeE/YedE family protein [Chlorobiota bacterium]
MGPLYPQGLISEPLNLLIALFIGIGFGIGLEAGGFTNTRKLAGVFYGYDFVVLKVFFTAALTGAIGLFLLDNYGLMDIELTFYPKTFWIPTTIAGIIMGLGFIIGGFCPGTSVCAAFTGKIDGIYFVIGAFIGILGYGFTYEPLFEKLRNSGGLGKANIAAELGISDELFIFIVTVFAVVAFIVANKIQQKVNSKNPVENIEELGL